MYLGNQHFRMKWKLVTDLVFLLEKHINMLESLCYG
jgi:hypothetical protein